MRSARSLSKSGLITAGLILAAGCSSEPPRGEALTALAQTTIIPAFEQFENDADELATAAFELCAEPSDISVEAVNQALEEASKSWSFTEPMWAGPVMERSSWTLIDRPADPIEIERLLASDDALDIGSLSQGIETRLRGLGAVEHMVSSDDVLETLDERRCAYLTAITSIVSTEASAIAEAWTSTSQDGVSYLETVADPESAHLDSLVNDSLVLLEEMADVELGRALGAMAESATLDVIEEGPGGFATSDMQGHLAGLRALFLGAGGEGEGLTLLLGDEITSTLVRQFDTAEAAFAEVGSPLRDEIVNSVPIVGAARDGLIELQVTIGAQVVAKLGVTIGFSDADGDTG